MLLVDFISSFIIVSDLGVDLCAVRVVISQRCMNLRKIEMIDLIDNLLGTKAEL